MDDNTRDIAIAVITTIGGFLTALVVAHVVAGRDRGLESLRWRRELYADVLRTASGVADAVRGYATPMTEREIQLALDRLLRLHFEVAMIRPAIQNETGELHEQTKNLVHAVVSDARSGLGHRGGGMGGLGRAVPDAQEAYLDAWLAFRERASKDLGVSKGRRQRVADWWRRLRDRGEPDDE